MVRVKYSNALVLAMAVGALLLTACSSTPVDKTIGMSPNAIHAEAKEEMSNSQWDKAIPLLEKLEARAAGTVLAQQAQLDKAYAHFKNGEQAQALATLDRFIKLHPASSTMIWVCYRACRAKICLNGIKKQQKSLLNHSKNWWPVFQHRNTLRMHAIV